MTQTLFLAKNPRGRHALRHLGAPPDSGSAEDPDLFIDATAAQVVDAFTGAVTMAEIENHLGKPGRGRGVTVKPPEGGEVHGRFYTMMNLAPKRCRVEHASPTPPVLDSRVLVPAVRLSTVAEADVMARFLRTRSQQSGLGTARLAPREAGLLATALPDLVDNALRHARDSSCGVIVCAALESDSREVQLVVTDLGTAVSRSSRSLHLLRDAWARSRTELGSLHYLTERASKFGIDASVQIRTGDAQGRWRRRWHSDNADFTPGWTVCVTIHR
jgi:anti-sigma regulatory factor (Ser/Thr protein kinase)